MQRGVQRHAPWPTGRDANFNIDHRLAGTTERTALKRRFLPRRLPLPRAAADRARHGAQRRRAAARGTTPDNMIRRCFARVTLSADIDGSAVELCAGIGAAIDAGTNTYRSRGSQTTLALPARPQRGARLSTPARYHHRSRGNQATIALLDGYRDQLGARSAERGVMSRRLQAATPTLTL